MRIMEAFRLTLNDVLLAVLDEALLVRQQIELLSPWEFESGVEKHIDLVVDSDSAVAKTWRRLICS